MIQSTPSLAYHLGQKSTRVRPESSPTEVPVSSLTRANFECLLNQTSAARQRLRPLARARMRTYRGFHPKPCVGRGASSTAILSRRVLNLGWSVPLTERPLRWPVVWISKLFPPHFSPEIFVAHRLPSNCAASLPGPHRLRGAPHAHGRNPTHTTWSAHVDGSVRKPRYRPGSQDYP